MSDRRRSMPIWTVLAVVTMALVAAAPVSAKGKPDKPPKPTTTSEAPNAAPSCAERNSEYGADWNLGTWNGSDAYEVTGFASCVDLDQPGHTEIMTWTVTWEDGVARKVKDFRLVFEQGVHGTLWSEHFSSAGSGTWKATILPDGAAPLVFVAMARPGDKWLTEPHFTVTPNVQGS